MEGETLTGRRLSRQNMQDAWLQGIMEKVLRGVVS